MTKVIVILCMFTQMLYAEKSDYTFEYYKAKTIELLSIVGIGPVNLTFVTTDRIPTIEEYQKNPNVVFVNVEKLNAFNDPCEALIECLVEAQLSCISKENWEKLIEPPRPIPSWIPAVLLFPFVWYLFSPIPTSPLQQTAAIVLIVLSTCTSFLLALSIDESRNSSKRKFEQTRVRIQLDTKEKFLSSSVSILR